MHSPLHRPHTTTYAAPAPPPHRCCHRAAPATAPLPPPPQEVFDRYNENLVQLPDEMVQQVYKSFMLIYIEEADEETLASMQAGQG